MYLSIAQFFRHDALLLVRTAGDPQAVIPSLHAEVRKLDPDLPLFDVRTVAEHRAMSVFIPRMASLILGIFGGLALLLSVVGLYSVVAYGAAQRRREIGVRMALGASRASVMRLVVTQGLRLIVIGLILGAALAAAAGQALRSQLIGVTPLDPVSFGLTMALLTLVAVLACAVPARRAARLDPVRALRME